MSDMVELLKVAEALPDKAREGFACLAVFPPHPTTFNVEAFVAVTELDNPRRYLADYVSKGLLNKVGNRYSISKEASEVARSLCGS